MTTQLKPGANSVQFISEPIWTPEGFLRITMWRDLTTTSPANALLPGIDVSCWNWLPGIWQQYLHGKTNVSIVVTLRHTLFTKLPVQEIASENYFDELTVSDFEVGIYNTLSPGDILSVTINGVNAGKLSFPTGQYGTDGRFVRRFLKQYELQALYGKVEFQPFGETTWYLVSLGQAQNAIAGDDYRWLHAKWDTPYLDENANKPQDAEQIYDFKFIHASICGLDQVPSAPIDQNGNPYQAVNGVSVPGQSWELPAATIGAYSPSFPDAWGTIATQYSGAWKIPAISQIQTSVSGAIYNPKWIKHMDVLVWLYTIFDYAFGVGNWTFYADTSPFEIMANVLTTGSSPYPLNPQLVEVAEQKPSGMWLPLTIAFDPAKTNGFTGPGSLFVPCSLWRHDVYNPNNPTPDVSEPWPSYHKSSWDDVHEFCMIWGWFPLVDIENGKATIYFKDVTTALASSYAGPVPSQAKFEAFPESEAGISVSGKKTFQLPVTGDGWEDDLYSRKRGASTQYDLSERTDPGTPPARLTLIKQTANPYIVPESEKKPATLDLLPRLDGYNFAYTATPTMAGVTITWDQMSTSLGAFYSYQEPGNSQD